MIAWLLIEPYQGILKVVGVVEGSDPGIPGAVPVSDWNGFPPTSNLNATPTLDPVSLQVVWRDLRSIDEARKLKSAEINLAWSKADLGTFSFGGKVFSCDAVSRQRIRDVQDYLTVNSRFPEDFASSGNYWKAADNTFLHLPTKTEWSAFYSALLSVTSQNFAIASVLKNRIAEATLENLTDVRWP